MKRKLPFSVFCMLSCVAFSALPALFALLPRRNFLTPGDDIPEFGFPALFLGLSLFFYFSCHLIFWTALPEKFNFILQYVATAFFGSVASWYSVVLISWRYQMRRNLSLEDFAAALGGAIMVGLLMVAVALCFWASAFVINVISARITKTIKLP